jgi:hypothetical protein
MQKYICQQKGRQMTRNKKQLKQKIKSTKKTVLEFIRYEG